MQLDLASQYQMQISTRLRTVAEFKEVAQKYGFLSGEILYGAFRPDSVYLQIVKQNPDPDGSIRAFREAQPTAESADLGHLETCESFYEYLTSLDPLTPTYWPLVYKRLRLDYDSNSIPLNRIHFRPGNLRAPGEYLIQGQTSFQIARGQRASKLSISALNGAFFKVCWKRLYSMPRSLCLGNMSNI